MPPVLFPLRWLSVELPGRQSGGEEWVVKDTHWALGDLWRFSQDTNSLPKTFSKEALSERRRAAFAELCFKPMGGGAETPPVSGDVHF